MSEERAYIKKQLGDRLSGMLDGKSLPEIKGIIHSMSKEDRELYKIIASMTMSRYGRKMLARTPEGKKRLFFFNLLSFVNFIFLIGVAVLIFYKLWWPIAAVVAVYFFLTNPLQSGMGYDLAARMILEANEIQGEEIKAEDVEGVHKSED